MIEAILPRVRRKILALLLVNPDRGYHLRAVVREVGCGRGSVARELHSLTSAGILSRESRGNLVIYRANRDCPIFKELHMLMVKTEGMADVLREALANVDGIRLAFVYGSMAAGTADSLSDVDVMVVGDVSFADVSGALLTAQDKLDRDVVPTVYGDDEFRERLEDGSGFLRRVLSEERIDLIGDIDDLG